ncbi:hypothetical protein AA11826_2084 [Komagataeibacter oboediens DSM 11826]|nr:hypothetical protein AA11826_2084 [Komagataeibacter oboediens DSM 11826]
MKPDDGFHHAESKPITIVRTTCIKTEKAVEYPKHSLGWNAGAVIGYLYVDTVI